MICTQFVWRKSFLLLQCLLKSQKLGEATATFPCRFLICYLLQIPIGLLYIFLAQSMSYSFEHCQLQLYFSIIQNVKMIVGR